MSATVISLEDFRKKRISEDAGKRLRGLGFPDDFLVGPDELDLLVINQTDPTIELARQFEEEKDNGNMGSNKHTED